MKFIESVSPQKLRGGYYTPHDLATFLSEWVLEIKPNRVLEPSCGDGAFFGALSEAGARPELCVTAFELDPIEAGRAKRRAESVGMPSATVQASDFLEWSLEEFGKGEGQFDAVVGNPPFIRYQYLPPQFQARAEKIFRSLDLKFTKHTNAWVPFVLASVRLLKPGGRIAMVVPAEILHVLHAQSLRTYLGQECARIVLIDPVELWFSGTLQGAVLLLAEKRSTHNAKSEGLGVYSVRNREFLKSSAKEVFETPLLINGRTISGKWMRALLNSETLAILDELENMQHVHHFSQIADVAVGIVTGANKFFLVNDETVRQYSLEQWAYPMFGRSAHSPGVIYDEEQHAANAHAENPTNFLWFKDEEPMLRPGPRSYIETGELEGLHRRYKCRIRSPWYAVPSVYSTEVGMLKRTNDIPRLIYNKKGAYTTDTAYRIRPRGDLTADSLVAFFINGVTALSAELEGRHYGGGVLELVPSEINRLLVPTPPAARLNITELNRRMLTQKAEEVLEWSSGIVLGALGMPRSKQEAVVNSWKQLRDRRQRI